MREDHITNKGYYFYGEDQFSVQTPFLFDEIWEDIFKCLGQNALLVISLTCSRFREISYPLLWMYPRFKQLTLKKLRYLAQRNLPIKNLHWSDFCPREGTPKKVKWIVKILLQRFKLEGFIIDRVPSMDPFDPIQYIEGFISLENLSTLVRLPVTYLDTSSLDADENDDLGQWVELITQVRPWCKIIVNEPFSTMSPFDWQQLSKQRIGEIKILHQDLIDYMEPDLDRIFAKLQNSAVQKSSSDVY